MMQPSKRLIGIWAGCRHSRAPSLSQRWSQRFSFRINELEQDSNMSMLGSEQDYKSTVTEKASTRKPSTWRLLKLNAPEWPYAILGSISAILSGWKTPLTGLGMSTILVTFYYPDPVYIHQQVHKVCVYFAVGIPVSIVVFLMQSYFFELMGEHVTVRVRQKLFSGESTPLTISSVLAFVGTTKGCEDTGCEETDATVGDVSAILRQEVGWFDEDENNSSLLASRLASNSTAVRAAVGDRMSMYLQTLSLLTMAFGIGFYLEWHITSVLLATYPLTTGAFVAEVCSSIICFHQCGLGFPVLCRRKLDHSETPEKQTETSVMYADLGGLDFSRKCIREYLSEVCRALFCYPFLQSFLTSKVPYAGWNLSVLRRRIHDHST